MGASLLSASHAGPDRSRASEYWTLAIIGAVFLALRAPLMYRQPGGLDEDWYSVPGWTVAHEGIPRVPYAPSRDPASAFYRVDEVLLAMPPAYFYWQAPFFLLLPDGYGTARLASAVAGLIAVWLVYCLGRSFYRDPAAGLWAAGLYSISRAFYFPAQTARPDMLCAAAGLAAVLVVWQWQTSGRLRYLFAAGALVGLGGLTHPFALAYALQLGAWVLLVGRGIRHRVVALAVLAAGTVAVLSLWLPLILAWPDVFRAQFFNNVLDRAGPGLLDRFLVPWPWFVHHSKILLELVQPPQLAMMAVGLAGATLIDFRRESGPRVTLALAWSSLYFMAVCLGSHSLKGYWCYPVALVFVCLGRTVVAAARRFEQSVPRMIPWVAVAAVLSAAMLPGSGIRAWMAHIEHWSDIQYNAPRFAERLFHDLPREARLTVDPAFVFNAFLDGRKTILAVTDEFLFDATAFPYDYLIVARVGIDKQVADDLDARFVRAYGSPDDVFACHAELYVPKENAEPAIQESQ